MAIVKVSKMGSTIDINDFDLPFYQKTGWNQTSPTSGSLNRTLSGTTPYQKPPPGQVLTPAGGVNPQGLTMEQANQEKYWKDGKYIGVDQTTLVPILNRTLGVESSPLQAFKNLLQKSTQLTYEQGSKPSDILQQYANAGIPLTDPGAIGNAISGETETRANRIGDVYTSRLNAMDELQKQIAQKKTQDDQYAQTIFKNILDNAPSFLTTATPQEIADLRAGNFTPEIQVKLQAAQQMGGDSNKILSPSEAATLGVPYGTTQGQAASKGIVPKSGLTDPQKISTFNSIVNYYNKSPLIAAADRTIVLKNSIEQARKAPDNGANQLSLVYSYVQALDTYQSAVREGELGLVNSIDSKIGALSNYVQQIQNGQIVRPEVIKQIADSAQNIVDTIDRGAKQKAQSFASQAEVSGVGEEWKQFISGANPSYQSSSPQSSNVPKGSSSADLFPDL